MDGEIPILAWRKRLSCASLGLLFGLCWTCIGTPTILYERLRWELHQDGDYRIRVHEYGPGFSFNYELSICDDEVVSAVDIWSLSNPEDATPLPTPNLDNIEQYTVDAIYEEILASHYWPLCQFAFNSHDHYPRKWHCGFIEGYYVIVSDFERIECVNGAPNP